MSKLSLNYMNFLFN